MDPAFERALLRIPPQLRERPGARFSVILNGTKKPVGKDWSGPNGANYSISDAPLAGYLAEGHNYGVLCGHAGITVPDLDDPNRLEELGILQRIPETWQVKTGRGGRHVYFDCPELDHQIGLYDPELKDEDGEPLHLGEIQSLGQQVVGPGSIHPNGNRYEIINDAPILPISKADLLKIFDGLILTGIDDPAEEPHRAESRRRKAGGASVGDYIPIDQVCWPKDVKEHHGPEVIGSHPVHGSKTGKNFSVNTAKNCWHCFRCGPPGKHQGGGGPLEWLAVEAGLISCKDAKPGCLDKETFKKVLQIARDRGFSIPEQEKRQKTEEQKPKGPTVSDVIERTKNDARALKDPAILATLADLKSNDPIEFDLTVDEIKKAHKGLKVDTIRSMVDKFILESKEANNAPPETPEAIKEKALAIAERGDPLKYLVWQAQRNHLGDIDYQKVLIASIASTASKKSNGIQPGGNGDKGSGKSDACESVYHLVPVDRRLDGSLSPMSLFYLQQSGRIQAGMVLYSDDVEYEPIIPIYKRSTAGFQKSTTHFSVTSGKNREAIELTIPPRIVWWLTSVESVANEQAFDRQYPISTDSSPAHKKRVADEIAARRARKELKLEEDEGIAVARAILADMFDNGPFKVVIPQAKEAKWLRTADFRGQEQFWDMVDALAILRWRQRKKDPDGWLIADDRDLIEAKEIHSGHKAAHFADLTEAEVKVVGVMSDGIPKTQGQLTEALNVAQSTLSERLRSIMAKSPLITEEYEHGKKTYTINHNATKLDGDFWNGLDLIDLGISSKEAYRSQQIALSVCYRYVIGLPIGIVINNSKRIPTTLTVDKRESTEKGCTCDDCGRCPLGKLLSSIHSTDKTTDNVQKQQQEPLSDTDKSDRYDPISTDKAYGRPTDIPIRHTSEPMEPPKPQVCAKCGDDLTGHGTITKNGVIYCLKPGCGMPAREEGEA